MIYRGMICLMLGFLLTAVACDGGAKQSASKVAKASIDGAKYLLASEPGTAVNVIDARKSAKHDATISLVGRIGGSTNPWIEGLAAFTIVDTSLKACSDIPGDTCSKPWDYCCESKESLSDATALVKFVDDQGRVLNVGARDLLRLAELNTVVVTGKAQRDDAGNLTLLASGLFVRK